MIDDWELVFGYAMKNHGHGKLLFVDHCYCWLLLSSLILVDQASATWTLCHFQRGRVQKHYCGPHAYFVVPLVPPQWGVHVADMQVKDNLGSHAQRFHWTTKSHQLFRMQQLFDSEIKPKIMG